MGTRAWEEISALGQKNIYAQLHSVEIAFIHEHLSTIVDKWFLENAFSDQLVQKAFSGKCFSDWAVQKSIFQKPFIHGRG